MDGTIMEFFKWFIGLIGVMFLLSVSVFFYQTGQANRYVSFVAAEIERGDMVPVQKSGKWVVDFTPEAKARLKKESDESYDGRYTVALTSTYDTPVVDYGDKVTFDVKGTYKILFADTILNGMLNQEITESGISTVQVRQIKGNPSHGRYVDATTALNYVERDLIRPDGMFSMGGTNYYGHAKYASSFPNGVAQTVNGNKYITNPAGSNVMPAGVYLSVSLPAGADTGYALVKSNDKAKHDAKIKSAFPTSVYKAPTTETITLGDGTYVLYTFEGK